MPFQSKSQLRACFARNDPNWDCREWAHATPSIKKLPDKLKTRRKEALDMGSPIAALGAAAAERPLLEKFSADTGLSTDQIQFLATANSTTPAVLAKWAYANPPRFADLVRRASGVKTAAAKPQPAPKPRVKEAAASVLNAAFVKAARKAIEKKAAANQKLTAMTLMNHYLDKVAAALPMEKQASVRTLQSGLALGKPLSFAIKVAYPQLTGEQRGALAAKLVKGAADDFKFWLKKKQDGQKTAHGKPGDKDVQSLMKSAGLADLAGRAATAGKNLLTSGKTIARTANANRPVIKEGPGAQRAARHANVRQQVGDRNMLRAALGGLGAGGAGVAAVSGGKPQPTPKPPTVRG